MEERKVNFHPVQQPYFLFSHVPHAISICEIDTQDIYDVCTAVNRDWNLQSQSWLFVGMFPVSTASLIQTTLLMLTAHY